MPKGELGSWSRAVTCADGTWQTRGFHSKNATFSIRNYYSGALLYYKHLCQKGQDRIIKQPLYKGTSKSAEGYSARQLLKTAQKEGMNIEVHWQDADSSASKHVSEAYPKAKVMICGGHAGKAHLKQLKLRGKQKYFKRPSKKEIEMFPDIENVECHCQARAKEKGKSKGKNKKPKKFNTCKAGCGCLTDNFCTRSRNSFSNILSTSQSASEFSKRLRGLFHHVQDEHQWKEDETCDEHDQTVCKQCHFKSKKQVARQCDFHSLTVCNCGDCTNNKQHKCEGKSYHTREVLSCPFHLLAYKLDCQRRIEMADQLVHPTMKRGHSNWLESSHNVLIRFRPKHIFLERLHYIVATNLGLMQANMTYEYQQQGDAYHWKTELYKRLNLPVYDGVQELLAGQNRKRKKYLDKLKSEKFMRRRVQLKKLRLKDAWQRKLWSKHHGEDTYGENDTYGEKDIKGEKGVCKKCGSDTHASATHRLCPYNKKGNKAAKKQDEEDTNQDTDDDKTNDSDVQSNFTDVVDEELLDEMIYSGCSCSALGSKAHTRACPMNPRNLKSVYYNKLPDANIMTDVESNCSSDENDVATSEDDVILITKSDMDLDTTDVAMPECANNSEQVHLPEKQECTCNALMGRAHSRKCPMNPRNKQTKDDTKNVCPNHKSLQTSGNKEANQQGMHNDDGKKVGDTVCVHFPGRTGRHLICRIALTNNKRFTLYCKKGRLLKRFTASELHPTDMASIDMKRWKQSKAIGIPDLLDEDMLNCSCKMDTPEYNYVRDDEGDSGKDLSAVKTLLYTLKREDIDTVKPLRWLNDAVIAASQEIIAQKFPNIKGLQPTTLQQVRGFDIHREDFVQILNVDNTHWCVVSNIGCQQGHINVYDTLYETVQQSIIPIIASMIHCMVPSLFITMVDIGKQTNSFDCGVLAIAIAFDLCAGYNSSTVVYDHRCIRQHLLASLLSCSMHRFPITGTRRVGRRIQTKEVPLHCFCRMPKEDSPNNPWVKCTSCGSLFHKVCAGAPDITVHWKCDSCT